MSACELIDQPDIISEPEISGHSGESVLDKTTKFELPRTERVTGEESVMSTVEPESPVPAEGSILSLLSKMSNASIVSVRSNSSTSNHTDKSISIEAKPLACKDVSKKSAVLDCVSPKKVTDTGTDSSFSLDESNGVSDVSTLDKPISSSDKSVHIPVSKSDVDNLSKSPNSTSDPRVNFKKRSPPSRKSKSASSLSDDGPARCDALTKEIFPKWSPTQVRNFCRKLRNDPEIVQLTLNRTVFLEKFDEYPSLSLKTKHELLQRFFAIDAELPMAKAEVSKLQYIVTHLFSFVINSLDAENGENVHCNRAQDVLEIASKAPEFRNVHTYVLKPYFQRVHSLMKIPSDLWEQYNNLAYRRNLHLIDRRPKSLRLVILHPFCNRFFFNLKVFPQLEKSQGKLPSDPAFCQALIELMPLLKNLASEKQKERIEIWVSKEGNRPKEESKVKDENPNSKKSRKERSLRGSRNGKEPVPNTSTKDFKESPQSSGVLHSPPMNSFISQMLPFTHSPASMNGVGPPQVGPMTPLLSPSQMGPMSPLLSPHSYMGGVPSGAAAMAALNLSPATGPRGSGPGTSEEDPDGDSPDETEEELMRLKDLPEATEGGLFECLDSLTSGVLEHHRVIQPTREDRRARMEFLLLLKDCLRSIFRSSDIEVFGSSAMGLETCFSDLDVGIFFINPRTHAIEEFRPPAHRVLMSLADMLCFRNVERVVPILRARVPILKITHFGVDCDVSLRNPANMFKAELVREYCQIDERVAPFLLAIKTWRQQRCISSSGRNPMNSFCCILLGLSFLQLVSPPVLPCLQKDVCEGDNLRNCKFDTAEKYKDFGKQNKLSLGDLFFLFFEHYTTHVDWNTQRVSVRCGMLLPKRASKFKEDQRTIVCIEDPFDIRDNAGRNVTRRILKRFRGELDRGVQLIKCGRGDFETIVAPYVQKPKVPKKKKNSRKINRNAAKRLPPSLSAEQPAGSDGSNRKRGSRRSRNRRKQAARTAVVNPRAQSQPPNNTEPAPLASATGPGGPQSHTGKVVLLPVSSGMRRQAGRRQTEPTLPVLVDPVMA
eukprot:592030_1